MDTEYRELVDNLNEVLDSYVDINLSNIGFQDMYNILKSSVYLFEAKERYAYSKSQHYAIMDELGDVFVKLFSLTDDMLKEEQQEMYSCLARSAWKRVEKVLQKASENRYHIRRGIADPRPDDLIKKYRYDETSHWEINPGYIDIVPDHTFIVGTKEFGPHIRICDPLSEEEQSNIQVEIRKGLYDCCVAFDEDSNVEDIFITRNDTTDSDDSEIVELGYITCLHDYVGFFRPVIDNYSEDDRNTIIALAWERDEDVFTYKDGYFYEHHKGMGTFRVSGENLDDELVSLFIEHVSDEEPEDLIDEDDEED